MNNFDKQEIEVLRIEIQSALDIIKLKYGLSQLSIENIYFSIDSFSAKIAGRTQYFTVDEYKAYEAQLFAIRNQLPENILGRTFVTHVGNQTIIRSDQKIKSWLF